MSEELLTVEEVAARLRVHPASVRYWLRQGHLKGVRAGRQWRIRPSDLEAFLAREVEPHSR